MSVLAPMRFTLEYPSELPTSSEEFLTPEVLRTVAQAAEDAGFAAIALSDHPAPSVKWRHHGGHNTIDPVAVLSFMAAVTQHISLMTNLYVLPFRNPFVTAKALGGLDLVSGGRLIAGVGAGYLRSEFAAVGSDFDNRASLFDEGLSALGSIWRDPENPVTGTSFATAGPVWSQPPAQQPHPPIWIGGNSRAALRRVAEHGSGWMPLITDQAMASAIRTRTIASPHQLSQRIDELHTMLAARGRTLDSVDIQVPCPPVDLDDTTSVRSTRAFLDDLHMRGVDWAVVHVDGSSPQAATRYIDRFAELFIERPKGV